MASRKFTLFHMSLIEPRQPYIWAEDQTREEWLRHALAEPFEFSYRGDDVMYWVPREAVDECIFGLVERKKPHEHHRPPEEGGAETVSEVWQGAYILLDPTHHDDGQKVAIENDVVGKPSSLLKMLVGAINARDDRPYVIEFEPIFDSASFWEFANIHGKVLKSVEFDFVVPNMWGAKNALDEDLKDTGQQTGAERVKVGLKGESGIYTDNQKIRDGVEYAERGAGKITAKAEDGDLYSSDEKPKTTKVPAVTGDGQSTQGYFANLKERILGRDKKPILDGDDAPDTDAPDN